MIRLIMRYIDESISEEEKQILQQWLDKSQDNRNIFNKLVFEDSRIEEIKKMSSYNKEKAWKKIKGRNKKKSFQVGILIRVAAIIAIIITSGILIYDSYNFDHEKFASSEKITAGRSTARLITSSGESFDLDTITSLYLSGKSKLENDGKELIINTDKSEKENNTKDPKYNIIQVPRGGEYNMKLADGTRIHLNSESSIRFPAHFTGDSREIFLKGEAYFDVKKDSKPFIVHVNNTYIKVLGTSFNINAYKETLKVQTTLVSGSVAMGNKNTDNEIKLKPGDQGEFDLSTNKISKRKVDVNYYTSWKNGIFAFEDMRFDDVMTILSRWYEFNVFYQNAEVKDIKFTGKMKRYSNIKEILHNFEMTEDINFSIKGKSIIIRRNK